MRIHGFECIPRLRGVKERRQAAVATVAEGDWPEAGNSPKIIFSNYRELVKPADAVKWLGVQPETLANFIQAPMVAAAV